MDARADSPHPVVATPSLRERVAQHLAAVYRDGFGAGALNDLADELLAIMRVDADAPPPEPQAEHWDQRTALMIAYGDSIVRDGEMPLQTLKSWLDRHAEGCLTGVHVLPFYPYSSDDGFAVIDYLAVNEALGDWEDVLAVGAKYELMADLVINHCSAESEWFRNFLQDLEPGRDYFVTASPNDDLSQVVRPRTSSLLREVETVDGTRHVWCTFSHDQVDLNFANPEVLKRMLEVVRHYLDRPVRMRSLLMIAATVSITSATSFSRAIRVWTFAGHFAHPQF